MRLPRKRSRLLGTRKGAQQPKLLTGFTLIELIVALGVFSIVVTIAAGAFLDTLRAQRVTFAEQSISQETRYALEFMSRQIRVAGQDGEGGGPITCLDASDSTPRVFDVGDAEIQFLNGQGECVRFFLNNGHIEYESEGVTEVLTSSPTVMFESLQFVVRGNLNNDGEQPRVTVVLTARGAGGTEEQASVLTAQTTITTRALDAP